MNEMNWAYLYNFTPINSDALEFNVAIVNFTLIEHNVNKVSSYNKY